MSQEHFDPNRPVESPGHSASEEGEHNDPKERGGDTVSRTPHATTASRTNISWVISAVLAITLVVVYVQNNSVIQNKDNEIARLKDKLESSLADSSTRQREYEEKIASLNQIIEGARKEVEFASQPEATFMLSTRKPLFGGTGKIAVLKNISSRASPVTFIFRRPSTNQQRQYDMVFDAGQSKEIGEDEGWAVILDDTLEVIQSKHKGASYTFH